MNPFDQFDKGYKDDLGVTPMNEQDVFRAMGGNPFDRFDGHSAVETPQFNTSSPIQPTENNGFYGRLENDWQNRQNAIDQGSEFGAQGKLSPGAVGYIEGGNKAGYYFSDVPGEIAKSAVEATPQFVKDAGNFVYNSVSANPVLHALGSGPAWLLDQAGQGYNKYKQNNPEYGLIADATLGYGSGLAWAAPIKGSTIPAKASAPANKVGNALYKSGEEAFNKKRNSFLQELITPKETPTVKADLFSRSKEQGILRSRVVEPTAHETAIMGTLSGLPVTKNKSLSGNYNIIKDANHAEANALINRLGQSNTVIPDVEINGAFQSVLNNLSKSPYLTTNGAAESVQRVIAIAQEQLSKFPKTPSGMLQARKAFDAEVAIYKKNVFDPAISSPVTDAVQGVRQAMNNVVAKAVPDAEVKSSLAKQSNLYRAMDAIETKGGWEGRNIISRQAQKLSNLIPGKGVLAKSASLTLGAGGAAMAPALALGAGGVYLAGKAVTSPTTRKVIGSAIGSAGNAATMDLKSIMKLPPKEAKAALEEMKLLAAPGKLSAVPMSEQEIAIAQAKLSRGRVNTVEPQGTMRMRPEAGQAPAKMLASPDKMSRLPMSEDQLSQRQTQLNRTQKQGPDLSGGAIKPPVSQFNKLESTLGKKRYGEFKSTVQIFKDGDMSQNQFIKEVTRKFGLNQTQARALAKEITTYKK